MRLTRRSLVIVGASGIAVFVGIILSAPPGGEDVKIESGDVPQKTEVGAEAEDDRGQSLVETVATSTSDTTKLRRNAG